MTASMAAQSQQLPDAVPFLRWAGGKRSLLGALQRHVPARVGTYHEPFVGGGALFFHLRARQAAQRWRLNDTSERLVRTYKALARSPEAVIKRLRRMPDEEAFFLKTRAREVDGETDEAVAAWMIYLNRTCFNGLYRVNRKGQFNVPYGHRGLERVADEENLLAVSRALRGVKLSQKDFREACLHAVEGDFVYCDPPYYPRVGKEFVGYVDGGFSHEDHVRLRDTMLVLKERGVRVLVSNSDVEPVRELYAEGFQLEEVRGARNIGAEGWRRGAIPDLLIW